MGIENKRQLENTRNKLLGLEEMYERTAAKPVENALLRRMTLRSLKQLINQYKEEIIRFESRATQAAK